MIRSELPVPVEPDDSPSLPNPDSLPIPLSTPIDGMLGISAGRATGRPLPRGLAALVDGRDAAVDRGLDAALRLVPPLRLLLLVAPLRALLVGLAVLRRAVAFFLPPARETLERLVVLRRAVDFFAVDRLAVDRLPVDFFADDFFFAAIDPPFGCAMSHRAR